MYMCMYICINHQINQHLNLSLCRPDSGKFRSGTAVRPLFDCFHGKQRNSWNRPFETENHYNSLNVLLVLKVGERSVFTQQSDKLPVQIPSSILLFLFFYFFFYLHNLLSSLPGLSLPHLKFFLFGRLFE